MRTGTRRCPTGSLPSLHSLQLGRVIDLNHAIDLAVRMGVVLTGVFLVAGHVHRCDAEVAAVGGWEGDLATAVFGSVKFRRGC